jgi:hypothetical protein
MIELLQAVFDEKTIRKCVKRIENEVIFCFDNSNGVSHFSNSIIEPSFQYFKNETNEYFIALDKCFIPNTETFHIRPNGFICKKRCDCAIFNSKEFFFLEFYHNGLENTTELTREDKIFQGSKQLLQTFYFINDMITAKTSKSMFFYFSTIKAVISMNYFPKDLGLNRPLTITRINQIKSFSQDSDGLELLFTNKIKAS